MEQPSLPPSFTQLLAGLSTVTEGVIAKQNPHQSLCSQTKLWACFTHMQGRRNSNLQRRDLRWTQDAIKDPDWILRFFVILKRGEKIPSRPFNIDTRVVCQDFRLTENISDEKFIVHAWTRLNSRKAIQGLYSWIVIPLTEIHLENSLKWHMKDISVLVSSFTYTSSSLHFTSYFLSFMWTHTELGVGLNTTSSFWPWIEVQQQAISFRLMWSDSQILTIARQELLFPTSTVFSVCK